MPAQVLERIGRAIHPFYNGSGGVPLRVGQFADGALDPVSVGSAPSYGPVE